MAYWFTCRPICLPRKRVPLYSLDKRLGGPHSRFGRRGEEKFLDPTGTRTPTVLLRLPFDFYEQCKFWQHLMEIPKTEYHSGHFITSRRETHGSTNLIQPPSPSVMHSRMHMRETKTKKQKQNETSRVWTLKLDNDFVDIMHYVTLC
jgi:hypothetical protein